MIDAVINQFGDTMGIKELALNEEGILQLSFENAGELFLEKADNDILMYLLKKVEYTSANLFWSALSLCYGQESYPFKVNPICSRDNHIGFCIRHSENSFTLQSINQSIEFLTELHRKLLG